MEGFFRIHSTVIIGWLEDGISTFSEEFLHSFKISGGSISCDFFCFFEGGIESRLSEIELPLGRSNDMILSEFFRLLEEFIPELSSLGLTPCKWLLVPKINELHV